MKTRKLKAAAIFSFLLLTGGIGWSKTPPSLRNFPEEHEAIRIDLERARQHKGELRCLSDELKADREAHRKMDVAIDKKEMKLSKAQLRNAKQQLRIDRMDLKQSYRYATKAKKERICGLHKAVKSAEMDLKKTMKYGNQASINRDAAYVAAINQAYLESQNSYAEFKVERDYDMVAIREDVREFKPQIANIVRSGNQDAYAGNCIVR